MNYTIGLSSETLVALQGLGGFSVDKLQEFFPIAVRQVYISGCVSLAVSLIFLVVAICAGVNFVRAINEECEDYKTALFMVSIGSFVICILMLASSNTVQCLLNPEYLAIEKMINMIKR